MFYGEIKPSERFSKYVKCYWNLIDDDVESACPEVILPDGCPEIVFNLGAPFLRHFPSRIEVQPQAIVVGQITGHISIQATNTVNLFGIRFHPSGIFPLVRSSLSELTDRIESLETILGKRGREIEEMIIEAKSSEERISIFERSLDRLIENSKTETLASIATTMIEKNQGIVKVENLATHLGTNWKTLQRHFNREVGINPKMFCRITRLQNVLQSINKLEHVAWTEIAYSFGFSDQAHFIKDFREFAGVSPGEFVRQQNLMSDSFVG